VLAVALTGGVFLLVAGPTQAVDKQVVERAIAQGVNALKAQQQPNGTWLHAHIGATALAGLTLLECGVPANDPVVQRAAAAVRGQSFNLTHTYSLSLAIIFFDLLGEPADVPLIESMTLRLLAGQTVQGGWTYNCPGPDEQEMRRLTLLVQQRNALVSRQDLLPPTADGKRPARQLSREIQTRLEQIRMQRLNNLARPVLGGLSDDNSNTQFAILALWVARRHGLAVEGALAEVERRFRLSQNADGGWSYSCPAMNPQGLRMKPRERSTPAMTCAGLLGLAAAHGVRNEVALRTEPRSKTAPRPNAGPVRPSEPSRDPAIRTALLALSTAVGHPLGARARPQQLQLNLQGGKYYYFLWSLERVALTYGLETLGRRDWYSWGAEILLANQGPDGSWSNGEFNQGGCDSAFALLFLQRANLMRDLTHSLQGQVKDPVELRSGGVGGDALLQGPKPGPDQFSRLPDEKPSSKPLPDQKPADKPPPSGSADTGAQAARLAATVIETTGTKQDQALEQLREGKGSAYTEALARAIPRLEGPARKKARETLAERLARMTAPTLADKLGGEDLEVRRAAALACAMREERTHVGKLIDLLQDPEPPVARAAYAALKSLSGQDFGPADDASRADRARAVAAWKTWWKNQGHK
jgi:hypothetical protein